MDKLQQNYPDLSLGAYDGQEEVLLLEDEHTVYFEQADRISANQAASLQRRLYLNALALGGFQEWMAERAAELPLDLSECSLLQPALATMVDGVCNLKVGSVRVCLIAVEELTTVVPFPRVAIALPEFTADFYGLVIIPTNNDPAASEREARVVIHGFLRHDELMERDPLDSLQLQPDWHDWMPSDWFAESPALVRLYLQCGGAALRPQPPLQSRVVDVIQHQQELKQVLSEYFASEYFTSEDLATEPMAFPQIWEVLSWQQGSLILSCPVLRDWWYHLSLAPTTVDLMTSFHVLLDKLTHQAFNTWQWLNHQLDDFSQYWQWSLQPPLVSAFRSALTPYQQAIAALQAQGIHLPTQASNACLDFEFAGCWLRLRAIPIPAIRNTETPAEWRLVIILEAQPNHTLPDGITLQVSDETALLDEQCLGQAQNAFLYSSVVGDCNEQFFVTIRLANGLALTLPAFSYRSDEV